MFFLRRKQAKKLSDQAGLFWSAHGLVAHGHIVCLRTFFKIELWETVHFL